ncbi:hypothetical protein GF376_03375 [Candidatus Peregrinibacteria bacterium]|nr:hypothetical protein [Candidatus Peregrinibacteria bacterium]
MKNTLLNKLLPRAWKEKLSTVPSEDVYRISKRVKEGASLILVAVGLNSLVAYSQDSAIQPPQIQPVVVPQNDEKNDEIGQQIDQLDEAVDPSFQKYLSGYVKVTNKFGLGAQLFNDAIEVAQKLASSEEKIKKLEKLKADFNAGGGYAARRDYAGITDKEFGIVAMQEANERKIETGIGASRIGSLEKQFDIWNMPVLAEDEAAKPGVQKKLGLYDDFRNMGKIRGPKPTEGPKLPLAYDIPMENPHFLGAQEEVNISETKLVAEIKDILYPAKSADSQSTELLDEVEQNQDSFGQIPESEYAMQTVDIDEKRSTDLAATDLKRKPSLREKFPQAFAFLDEFDRENAA